MQRRSLLRATGAAVFLAATPLVRAQGSQQKFKFNLGWKFEARPQAACWRSSVATTRTPAWM